MGKIVFYVCVGRVCVFFETVVSCSTRVFTNIPNYLSYKKKYCI